jgi:hypothetical protein
LLLYLPLLPLSLTTLLSRSIHPTPPHPRHASPQQEWLLSNQGREKDIPAYVAFRYYVEPSKKEDFVKLWLALEEETVKEKGVKIFDLKKSMSDNSIFLGEATSAFAGRGRGIQGCGVGVVAGGSWHPEIDGWMTQHGEGKGGGGGERENWQRMEPMEQGRPLHITWACADMLLIAFCVDMVCVHALPG